jgi:hypothetical protein
LLGGEPRKITSIDADCWREPEWVEDAETLRGDCVELGSRHARRFFDEKICNVSEHDAPVKPVDIAAARKVLESLTGVPPAARHLAASLAVLVLFSSLHALTKLLGSGL